MMNHPCEYHLDMSHHSSYMVLQTRIFYHKIISKRIFFAHPCMGLQLHLKLSVYACFLYISVTSQWISIQLVLQFTLCMYYKCRNFQTYPYTLSYCRAYFTQQSKRFYNSKLNRHFFI